MTACIVGWAHSPFGKLSGETVESLVVKVAGGALADAGIAAADVDEIVLGHFNAGFSEQDFTASLVLQASPDLRFKRATRVENACATGSAAVHQGIRSIAAGAARIVLVVGVEQMTTTPGAEVGRNLLKASYVREEADIDGGFAGIFGKIAGAYFQRWGDQSDALARIAAGQSDIALIGIASSTAPTTCIRPFGASEATSASQSLCSFDTYARNGSFSAVCRAWSAVRDQASYHAVPLGLPIRRAVAIASPRSALPTSAAASVRTSWPS